MNIRSGKDAGLDLLTRSGVAGFTMVEIALSLGIVAFALIAIIGVLPSGMKVQRENREDTIINQDGSYLLEAIRSGSRGVDDLTDYVESITITNFFENRVTGVARFTNDRPAAGWVQFSNANHIVSLLTTPKVEPGIPNRTNIVTARVRSISGNASDKSKGMTDFAFRYQVNSEVIAVTNVPPLVLLSFADAFKTATMAQNLYEVRLTLRWPLIQKGANWDVGRYRRTLRTLVSGELVPTWTNSLPHLYLFEPLSFTSYH